MAGDGGHRRGRGRRSEGVYTGGGNGIGIGVEFADGGDVAGDVHGAPHDHELLDAEEGLWVLGGGHGDVGERAHCADGDRVLGLFPQNSKDLLVGWELGWREVWRRVGG